MAYRWKILRSAVEQEILFPSRKNYEDYKADLDKKKEPFEVVCEKDLADGSVVAIMRKRYNYTAFLKSDRT